MNEIVNILISSGVENWRRPVGFPLNLPRPMLFNWIISTQKRCNFYKIVVQVYVCVYTHTCAGSVGMRKRDEKP